MTNSQLISKAKNFDKAAGLNPERYNYTVNRSFLGQKVTAERIGTQESRIVAFYEKNKLTKASR